MNSNAFLLVSFLPLALFLAFNIAMGIIASGMAQKRGLKQVPAFFAGLFASFTALFFIAMFPVTAVNQQSDSR
jgi:hypothetical protein